MTIGKEVSSLYTDDGDPYVHKTATVCVAKLYDIDAELVEDMGFLEALKDLIFDNSPMVVLLEFEEYATEVDVNFVRKTVRVIGRCPHTFSLSPRPNEKKERKKMVARKRRSKTNLPKP
ncbi:hypothetical protein RJT34_11749 [Clitoria ternatea]|uniref:Condensin complex subunit 1 C-terminal domain-containing protein n=1 Tax=Clitoria ternatea TaxID=43366 RepID=A0AAN9JN73_CLITE